ncbi:pilus assembly protein [Nocardioides carbamazepini]|uniref:pilus assembly protein TadG-related protein n=1 Tax=Nocardioides carbamazepini TaxID=2854259 RepID=UPI00214A35FA|nr:pilus assembly protein TadG-related protein [Nocardioides carbamazepini]MCR1785879.1 pilus assembly protein [Nocardioides carbamazepini]
MTHLDLRKGRGERGSVSIWLVTSSLAMILLVGLAVDLGGQVHAQQRAHDLAAQAARAGGQEVQGPPAIEGSSLAIDVAAARAAALRYLETAGLTGTVEVSSADTITVTVHDRYEPRFLGAVVAGDLPVTGRATAHLVRTLGGDPR